MHHLSGVVGPTDSSSPARTRNGSCKIAYQSPGRSPLEALVGRRGRVRTATRQTKAVRPCLRDVHRRWVGARRGIAKCATWRMLRLRQMKKRLAIRPSRSRKSAVDVAIGELVAELRRKQMTQHELAHRLHTNQSSIARLETGERRTDVVELLAVLEVLGVDPARFFRMLQAKLRKASSVMLSTA